MTHKWLPTEDSVIGQKIRGFFLSLILDAQQGLGEAY